MKTTEIKLRPIHTNVGIERKYLRELLWIIDAMHAGTLYYVRNAWMLDPPIAVDASPRRYRNLIGKLGGRWLKHIEKRSPKMAQNIVHSIRQRVDASMHRSLVAAKVALPAKPSNMTAKIQEVTEAAVHENAALIKSIPSKYFAEVEGLIMRSIQNGADLNTLAHQLEYRYQLTRKRAALIAKDQTHKVTQTIARQRQLQANLEEGYWVHSHAVKTPRPTHLANDGKKFNIRKGWYDPAEGRRIWPGTLIGCQCFSRAVVKGFS